MAERTAGWLRFFRSELRVMFGRRRNQALLAVVALFPVAIGVALRAADRPGQTGGPSVAFINQLAGNGFFLTFIALTLLLTLVLPLAMAVVAGDSVAGEAGYGTLRGLLAIPAGRARLLTVKLGAIHPYLPTHWWVSFDALLRVPTGTATVLHGLLSFGVYLLLSGSVAWARLGAADVTC